MEVNAQNAEEVARITAAFLNPFEPREVKWKAQTVKNNRCLAVAFIDARLVTERLDDVVKIHNWKDEYTLLPGGSVECRLSVRICGEWITKSDVGSESEQPDGGDRLKAAYSDALKRAAVKFGIGRYLYRLPAQWVDYDPVKKQIAQVPQLPAFAMPKGDTAQKPATPQPAKPVSPPQSPAPAKDHPALVNWRTRAMTATDRDMLTRVWEEYEKVAGDLPTEVRSAIVAAFGEAGKRFPKKETAKG